MPQGVANSAESSLANSIYLYIFIAKGISNSAQFLKNKKKLKKMFQKVFFRLPKLIT